MFVPFRIKTNSTFTIRCRLSNKSFGRSRLVAVCGLRLHRVIVASVWLWRHFRRRHVTYDKTQSTIQLQAPVNHLRMRINCSTIYKSMFYIFLRLYWKCHFVQYSYYANYFRAVEVICQLVINTCNYLRLLTQKSHTMSNSRLVGYWSHTKFQYSEDYSNTVVYSRIKSYATVSLQELYFYSTV